MSRYADLHAEWADCYARAVPRSIKPITASEWAREHVRLSPESSSVEGPFRPMPFQSVWLDIMGMDGGPEVVAIAKGARCGYTEALKAVMCYLLAEVKRNIIAYQPTAEDAKNWSRDSITPALRDCDATAELQDDYADPKRRGTQMQRWIGGKSISVRGAVAPGNFRRIGADAVLLDEVDGFSVDVGGEGSPVALASRAMATSKFRKMLLGSTPVDAGISLIWEEFMSADARFFYFVACPRCQKLAPLDWERLRWNKRGTVNERAKSVRYLCAKCNRVWHQQSLQAALEGGRWQVPDSIAGQQATRFAGHWIRKGEHAPELVDAKGLMVPWPHSVGFHVWRAYSTLSPWTDIPRQLLKAGKNPLQLKTFQNHVRGLPWGGDLGAKTPDEIAQMRRDLSVLPPEATRLFVTVDCQQDFLSVMTMAMSEDMSVWILSRDEYAGNPELDEGAAWAMLYDVIREGRVVASEAAEGKGKTRQLKLWAMAIDTGGLYTQATYRACIRLASVFGAIAPTKGVSTYNAAVAKRSTTYTENAMKIPLYLVGTHKAKILASHAVGRGNLLINSPVPRGVNDELVSERLVASAQWRAHGPSMENLGGANEAFDQLVMGVVLWTLSTPKTASAPRLSKFHAVKMAKGGVAQQNVRRQTAVDRRRNSAGVGRVGRANRIGGRR